MEYNYKKEETVSFLAPKDIRNKTFENIIMSIYITILCTSYMNLIFCWVNITLLFIQLISSLLIIKNRKKIVAGKFWISSIVISGFIFIMIYIFDVGILIKRTFYEIT